jgi:hypothetical protein
VDDRERYYERRLALARTLLHQFEQTTARQADEIARLREQRDSARGIAVALEQIVAGAGMSATDQPRPLSDADLAELEQVHRNFEKSGTCADCVLWDEEQLGYVAAPWPCAWMRLLVRARRADALEAQRNALARYVIHVNEFCESTCGEDVTHCPEGRQLYEDVLKSKVLQDKDALATPPSQPGAEHAGGQG